MYRHQHHLVVTVTLVAVKVSKQRHLLQEVRQINLVTHILLLSALHKVLHTAQELLKVLLSRQVLRVSSAVYILAYARVHYYVVTQCVGILRLQSLYPALYQLSEVLQLSHRALAHVHGEQPRLLYHLPQAHSVCLCRLYYLSHRSVAYSSRRVVYYALKRLLVVRVRYQSEVSYHVLYLLALVEAQSSVYPVRYTILAHLLLKASALRVSAVKYGKVAPAAAVVSFQSLNILRHNHRLLAVAVGRL